MKSKLSAGVLLLACVFAPLSLFGQSVEVNPYAGYYWSGSNAAGVGRFLNNQLLGVRGGFYITPELELGGNYSWSNHFQPDHSNVAANFAGALGFTQGAVRGNLWEAEFTYNFGKRSLFGSTVRPYVVGGTGGLTTSVKNAEAFVLNVVPVEITASGTLFAANDAFVNHDTFFTFSYGGGVKAIRLWGPLGVFGDVRGRTIPNFFGHATSRPEVSAGLNFSWGER